MYIVPVSSPFDAMHSGKSMDAHEDAMGFFDYCRAEMEGLFQSCVSFSFSARIV